MGNVNSIPVISQAKSAVQAICGDMEGARETQINFIEQAPVISQVNSAIRAIGGDIKGAERVQKRFVNGVSDFADGIPVVGHIKGGIHYAVGDKKGGDAAMKSSSRTVGVFGGAIAGTLTGGPVGGVMGGIAGGVAMDGITTGVESSIHHKYMPNGTIHSVTNLNSPGDAFDFVTGVAMDGFAGHGVSKGVRAIQKNKNVKRVYRVMNEQNAHESIQTKKIPAAKGQNKPFSEVCVTESTKHSKEFMKQRKEGNQSSNYKTVQIEVEKPYYDNARKKAIPQKNSKKTNQMLYQNEKRVENVFTNEKLRDHHLEKKNLNIKYPNLEEFNGNVRNIKEINPNHIKHKNGFTKGVSRYGGLALGAYASSVGCVKCSSNNIKYIEHQGKYECLSCGKSWW